MNHISDYLKKVSNKIDELWKNKTLLVFLLTAMLIALPLKHSIGSLTCMLFLLISFVKSKKADFSVPKVLIFPILLYSLMLFSLIWTIENKQTMKGLQKELLLLLIPLAFCGIPKINRSDVYKILRWYSFGMLGFAIFYVLKAIVRFINSGEKGVFFYHELVTLELNAIYMSVFASLALFYFLIKKEKSIIDKTAFSILIVFIFLLSSKNIIVVDFILIIIYYSIYSTILIKTKLKTLSTVIILLISTIIFIKPIRERFTIEFETIFVDGSLNKTIEKNQGPIYNISLKQAWNQDQFQQNDFFPGTAFRLFQIRIFKEMLEEENIFFTGFGLDASQNKIKEKVKEHNLYPNYGEFNFHNEYVQIFSELGIFGFLIVITMLFVTIRSGIINKDFIHIAFAVTMIVLFLTESFLSRQRGIIFFIVFYCMFNSVNDCNEQKILK